MNRRRFLGAVAGSLTTGCLGSPSPSRYDSTSFDAASTPPPRPTESTLQRIVTVESQDAVPGEHEIEIVVEMLEAEITDDHTARLRVTATNEGAPRGISIGAGGCNPFNRWDGGSDDPPGLWIFVPDRAASIPRNGDRWSPDLDRLRFPDYGCTWRDYASGESLANEYVVWDDPSVFGYLVPNTYRYERPVSVAPLAAEREAHEATAEFTWGFDLRVEGP